MFTCGGPRPKSCSWTFTFSRTSHSSRRSTPMTTLASSRVYTSDDCSPELAARADRQESSVSRAWLAAHEALQAQGGWYCLDGKAQKALGYTYHKVTVSEPFYHGAWIEDGGNTATLVIVDRTTLTGRNHRA